VEPLDLLATIPPNTDALAEAAAQRGLDTPVPSCPGWTVTDVISHLGSVQRRTADLVATGVRGRRPGAGSDDGVPDGAGLLGWLTDGARVLQVAGQEKGPDFPAWNWTGADQRAAFWFRRMAHETAVHCWDVRSACGLPTRLEPVAASDAIDELLTVILPAVRPTGMTGTLHVHCTDVDGEWTVELSRLEVDRAHRKGDAALRGPAADVLLQLLGRGDGAEVFGETAVLATWHQTFQF
jgi:uncharacterized protein (TIGR03083 family)